MASAVGSEKECCRCKKIKPTTEFRKRNRALDGLEYHCRSCSKLNDDKNREKHREADRNHYYKNREKRIAKTSRYNYKKLGQELPKYWVERLAKPRQSMTHEEAVIKNRERLKQYKIKNKEMYKEQYQLYCSTENGKENNRLKTGRYRAMKSMVGGLPPTREDIEFLFELQNGECACCGKEFDGHNKYELDHIIPLSVGGQFSKENIQLLCRSCNASKKNKTIMYRPKINFICLNFI